MRFKKVEGWFFCLELDFCKGLLYCEEIVSFLLK